ncbi:MAG TPA: alpha/beta hydrolase [Caulobacter sp.]|nr:alpha/beta hydrolase [Caulobacter sp.]
MASTPVFISFRASGLGGGVTDAQLFRIEPFAGYRWRDWTYAAHQRTDLKPLPLMSAERSAPLQGREVWFLVHGFNTDRDRGFMSLGAAVQEAMGLGVRTDPLFSPVDNLIPVLWPGDSAGFAPTRPLGYPNEIEDVRETAKHFARLLLDPRTRPARINFVTHSLGARVALDTLRLVTADANAPQVGTVLLMAAAADDDILDDPRFDGAVRAIERIIVLSSDTDRVLTWAFPPGDVLEAALHQGERPSLHALGKFGPRLKKDSPAAGKVEWRHHRVVQDHNDYNAWPWNFPSKDNGWNASRWRTHRFIRRAAIDYDPAHPDAWQEPDRPIVARVPRVSA